MYLKKLELKGFKSFPTKTDIYFEKGITAVVGPNGSGKSNISDAVRWVLGEQSVKSLRGEKMEDVIFSGTDTKSPMNYCEASITLDNSTGKRSLNSKNLVIKRRSYRTGESEFFINGKSCRLKDVRETLLDTGIGKDGYSIIEQGKVDEILSNNPQNRRKIFDEACGIAKYRYKKNDAEKNLKKSNENLQRINDIYTEIENQLKPLERQQEKARKYLELSERLKNLEINDFIKKHEEYSSLVKELQYQMDVVGKELNTVEMDRREKEEELQKNESGLLEKEKSIDEYNDKLMDINESISQKKNEKNLTLEKTENQLNEIRRKKDELKTVGERIRIEDTELEKANKRAEENSYVVEKLDKELEGVYENRKKIEGELSVIEKELEGNKENSIRILEEKQKITNSHATVQANMENMKKRASELESGISGFNAERDRLKSEVGEKSENLKELEEKLVKADEEIKNISMRKKKVESELIDAQKRYNSLNISINQSKAKMNTFVEMENQHEGFNKGVKEVLNNRKLNGVHGAFGELLKVPYEYEKAVEAALGAAIQNIVVSCEKDGKEAIEYLKKNRLGRVTFLPLDVIKGNTVSLSGISHKTPVIGIASGLVRFDEKYRNVVENALGRVIVLKDMDLAISFARETGHRYKLVTLEGDILNPGGAMTGGSSRYSSQIFSRKRMIEKLNSDIESISLDINELEKAMKNAESEKLALGEKMESLGSDRNILNNEMIAINAELKITGNIIEEKEKNIESYYKELSSIKEKLDENSAEKLNLERKLEDIQKNSLLNDNSIKGIIEKQEEKKKELEMVTKDFNNRNLNLVRLKQTFESELGEISRITKNRESSLKKMENLKESIKINEEDIDVLDIMAEKYTEDIVALEKNREEILSVIGKTKLEKDDLRDMVDDLNRELKAVERKHSQIKEDLFKIDSKLERNNSVLDNILFSMQEKYEMDYDEALSLRDESLVIEKKEIDDLKKAIRNLGNVNIDSIKEYEEISERYNYYSSQKEDLEQAIESLTELIGELTVNMEAEFLRKFEEINENFKTVYKKLFGGGDAQLSLEDDSDILGCDIDIKAQPPGKKMKSLMLLSGGEKALTAISILFAIIISRPTPFCILDEIEAPLDDVNVDRFGEYLRELSGDTQFIAVTHRRGTMEVADYIYGVTMQEKGVSSVLSIRLNEARKMIEA